MKKFVFLFILIAVLIFAAYSINLERTDVINYKLENKNTKLLVADTDEEWARGLMYVKNLKDAQGMIFVFPDYQVRSFWNKNTPIDLDVYWIYNDKVIGKSFLPSIYKTKDPVTITSPGPANKVVELIR